MTRSWWIALLAIVGLIATVLLPVAPAGERLWTGSRASDGGWGMSVAAQHLARRLQLFHWADSLGALTVEGAERGARVVVGSATDHPDARAQDSALARAVAEALDATATEGAALGRFQVDRDDGVDLEAYLIDTDEVLLAGESRGRAYCLTVTNTPLAYQEHVAAQGNLWPSVGREASPSEALGACWVVARYGLPGPHIASWFSRGGAYFATGHVPYDLKDLAKGSVDGLAGIYSANLNPVRLLSVRAQRCLAGRDDACAALLGDPLPPAVLRPASQPVPLEAAPVVALDLNLIAAALPGVLDPAFLAALERRFGREQFRAFWTSGAPLDEAFSEAFGMAPGAYVGREARTAFGSLAPGPGLPASGWLAMAFIVLAGLVVGAVVTGRRRPA
jgi:hypothetical protein